MNATAEIVKAVLKEINGRSGCDLREIIDDPDIYAELVEELTLAVQNVLIGNGEDALRQAVD